ncbi:1186_t:CDS:2, partial [Funneliformis mosseae]
MDQYWENLNQDFKSSSTSAENIVFDLPNWMKRFTTDTIFPALTGKRSYTLALYYNRLVNSKELKTTIPKTSCDSEEFIEAIRTWLHALQFFYFIPKFLRNYVPPFMFYRQKFLKSMSWSKSEILKIVKETRNELKEGGRTSNSDLLTLFCTTNTEMDSKRINNIDEFSRPLTDEEIMYSMFDVLTGGIDTSANSLCFIVYYLSKYPQYKQRLIEEIDAVKGMWDTIGQSESKG